jgi:hypothetical protein
MANDTRLSNHEPLRQIRPKGLQSRAIPPDSSRKEIQSVKLPYLQEIHNYRSNSLKEDKLTHPTLYKNAWLLDPNTSEALVFQDDHVIKRNEILFRINQPSVPISSPEYKNRSIKQTISSPKTFSPFYPSQRQRSTESPRWKSSSPQSHQRQLGFFREDRSSFSYNSKEIPPSFIHTPVIGHTGKKSNTHQLSESESFETTTSKTSELGVRQNRRRSKSNYLDCSISKKALEEKSNLKLSAMEMYFRNENECSIDYQLAPQTDIRKETGGYDSTFQFQASNSTNEDEVENIHISSVTCDDLKFEFQDIPIKTLSMTNSPLNRKEREKLKTKLPNKKKTKRTMKFEQPLRLTEDIPSKEIDVYESLVAFEPVSKLNITMKSG